MLDIIDDDGGGGDSPPTESPGGGPVPPHGCNITVMSQGDIPSHHRVNIIVYDDDGGVLDQLCQYNATVPEAVVMLVRLANTLFGIGPRRGMLIDWTGQVAGSIEVVRDHHAT